LQPRATGDTAAGQRPRLSVTVLDDRRQDRGRTRFPPGLVRVAPFADVPTIVPPAPDQVDHFPEILSDIARPQFTCGPVAAEAPGWRQPVPRDPGRAPCHTYERVIARDRVGPAALGVIHVEAKDRARQVAQALTVLLAATIARPDVEAAIGSERQ